MGFCSVSAVTVLTVTLFFRVSAQCASGEVRLVNGSGPSEGRVEICVNSEWGTVCDDCWDDNDTRVVCRQLDYSPYRAQALINATFGQGSGKIALDDVECDPSLHRTLLQCPRHRRLFHHDCRHNEDAGVRCEQTLVKSISAVNFTTPSCTTLHTVLISVSLLNVTRNESFQAGCYSQQHSTYVAVSVSNQTGFTIQLEGLFPSSLYKCCALAGHNQQYVGRGTCINIETPKLLTTTEGSDTAPSKSVTSVSIVGGILGFIITVLLVLLLLSVMTTMCLLRPKLTLRKHVPPNTGRSTNPDLNPNTSGPLPVERNLSYGMIPSSLATSGTYAGVDQAARQEADESAPNYSRLGPAHETADLRRQQVEASRNQISKNVCERYEFAEIRNMETDRQTFGDEEYSHLKH